MDAIAKAVRSNDVEALLAHFAMDVVVFDMLVPLEQKGTDALREIWVAALAPFEGPIDYDVEHLGIWVSGDVAFSRGLSVFGGTTKAGQHVVYRVRTTLGFRKIAGSWKVIHQHVSAPFDAHSGKAQLGLDK
jgi:ketosteroid isomerase-like protein